MSLLGLLVLSFAIGAGPVDNSIETSFSVGSPTTKMGTLLFTDGFETGGAEAWDEVVGLVDDQPPLLDPIGNQTVALGSTLALQLSANDPDNSAIQFAAAPLPMPGDAALDAITGTFHFQPEISDVGVLTLTFSATSGANTASETIDITVTDGAPGDPTTLVGRLLDTNDFVLSVETPVIGATIRLLGDTVSTSSATDGTFTLSGVSSGDQVLEIDASTAGVTTYTDTSGLVEQTDEAIRQAAVASSGTLDTGLWPYQLFLSSHYPMSTVGIVQTGELLINSQRESAFGAGWGLAGLQQLHTVPDRETVLITDGNGAIQRFEPAGFGAVILEDIFDGENNGEAAGGYDEFTQWDVKDLIGMPAIVFLVGNGVSDPWPGNGLYVNLNLPSAVGMHSKASFTLVPGTYQVSLDVATPQVVPHEYRADVEFRDPANPLIPMPLFSVVFDAGEVTPFETYSCTIQVSASAIMPQTPVILQGGGAGDCMRQMPPMTVELVVSKPLGIEDIPGGALVDDIRLTEFDGTMNFASPAAETSRLSRRADGILERREKTGTRREFDSDGRQVAHIDRNGNRTSYFYDASGRLARIEDPLLLDTVFTYSGDHLDSITDPAGRTTSFGHDPAGNLNSITDPDLSTRTFRYGLDRRMIEQRTKRGAPIGYINNTAGQNITAIRPDGTTRQVAPLAAIGLGDARTGLGTETNPIPVVRFDEAESVFTDGHGNTTRFKTNRFGTVGAKTDALGQDTLIAFDDNGNPSSITNPMGIVTEMDWDDRSNVVRMRQAVGTPREREVEYYYEPTFSRVVRAVDVADLNIRYDYDDGGNPTLITDPEDNQVIQVWDAEGRLRSRTDQRLKTTTFDYDARGNLFETTDALGRITQLERDLAGNVTDVVEAFGTADERRWVRTYDAMNRVLTATNPAMETTTFVYDEAGNRTSVERPSTLTTVATFDPEERLETLTAPEIGTTRFTYDNGGNLASVTDALDQTTSYSYDSLDRLETVLDPDGGLSTTTYDEANRVDTFLNARGKLTDFDWDELDQLTGQTNAEMQTVAYDYLGPRNLVGTYTDALGRDFVHEYDDLGRRTKTTTPDEVIDFTWDEAGNLRTITDADSFVELTYDDLGRVATSISAWAGLPPVTLTHGYHPAYNTRTSATDSLGGLTQYAYDAADRLDIVTAPSSATVDLDWDVGGRLTSVTHPNGVAETMTYDPLRGLMSNLNWEQGGTPIVDLDFAYDLLGRIDTVTEAAEITDYGYDLLGRLESAGTTTAPESYSYDEVGNRDSSHSSTLHVYDDADRLLEDDTYLYTYDASGNLDTQSEKGTPNVTTYSYDAQNRLIGVADTGGNIASYRYDGLGRRFEKVVNGVVTRYVHDGPDIVIEQDGAGAVVGRYTHGALVDQPLVMSRGGSDHFYLADHLGSIRAITDDVGAVANQYAYDGFGQTLTGIETVTNPFTYTAREQDAESGLLHYRARAYSPEMGRFTTQDPIGFGGGDVNFYGYVGNNPANFTDPSGLFSPSDFLDVVFVVISIVNFIDCPGFGTGAAVLGDGLGAILPFLPAPSTLTHADEVFDGIVDLLNTADNAVPPRSPAGLLNPPINITPSGLQHVDERHVSNAIPRFRGKSKFNSDEDVAGLIESATQQPMKRQRNGRDARTVDAGRPIGATNGTNTSTVTVITDNGNLVTAFPGRPGGG